MIELRVNGQQYGGWKSARVSRAVDKAAGEFSFTASEKWPAQAVAIDVRPGDACTVYVSGQLVLTGWVDQVQPRYTADTHEIAISGRSRTADLVDCSAVHAGGQWVAQPLQSIVRALVAPFNIPLVFDAPAGAAIPNFQLQQGEAVYNAIDRLCAMQAFLVCDDPQGNCRITRAGSGRASGQIRFKRGDASRQNNVLQAGGTFSQRERFSRYIVKGQSAGTDNWNGEAATGIEAEIADKDIARYRPLLVVAETQADGARAAARAAWEKSTRRGKGTMLEYTVQGWVQDAGGVLWLPNTLVAVDDDFLQVRGSLLLAECSYEVGSNGTTTKLRLCPPEAYDVLAEKKPYTSKWSDLRPGA